MKRIVGVQFKRAGKIYDFDSEGFDLTLGSKVVVETERGLGLGVVVVPPREIPDEEAPQDLKKVIRIANNADIERYIANCERERKATQICKKLIEDLKLDMKLVNVDYFYDASKAVFHFVAAQRVDFRELVKQLAQTLHTRIEMKQVGVRDETKLVGGVGCCGRELCCSSFLREFTPVNVKMAKDQNLAMNPTKISGVCGRLMCCLAFEHQTYVELISDLPKKGKKVVTPSGIGKVTEMNILKKIVYVELEDGSTTSFPADKLKPFNENQNDISVTPLNSNDNKNNHKNKNK